MTLLTTVRYLNTNLGSILHLDPLHDLGVFLLVEGLQTLQLEQKQSSLNCKYCFIESSIPDPERFDPDPARHWIPFICQSKPILRKDDNSEQPEKENCRATFATQCTALSLKCHSEQTGSELKKNELFSLKSETIPTKKFVNVYCIFLLVKSIKLCKSYETKICCTCPCLLWVAPQNSFYLPLTPVYR